MASIARRFLLLAAVLAAGPASAAPAGDGVEPGSVRPFSHVRTTPGIVVVALDQDEWTLANSRTGSLVVEDLPLPGGRTIDLDLDRFSVVGPETRFVVGQLGGADRPLAGFDPSSVVMYRGAVRGYPASHVFLSIAPGSATARIDLGPGEGRFLMSHRGGGAAELREGELAVFEARGRGAGGLLASDVPVCATPAPERDGPGDEPMRPVDPPTGERGPGPIRGLQQLQLAVETDYDLFELFGDSAATATYVTQLYGVVSDIYIRDVNTRVELSFVRIWDNPQDLFSTQEDPLNAFRSLWNQQMQHVPRDVAQFFSGRRNLSAGGVAYLSALCGSNAYSWAGYALGFFSDPDTPSWTSSDIMVTAHELGHNCGTGHTHDYGLDTCQTGDGPAHRGSIMSYCGQGYSGGDANHDLWFHEHTANLMRQHIFSRTCVADDCNRNSVLDSTDISSGASSDANSNGIPDECEDCNGNGVLDPQDITLGTSADVNANAVPDECEPDCNGNNLPDPSETVANPAIDLNANRIPDSCEGDCDGDGVADYNEIQADMTLDVDRNVVLDSCQRCIPGGPTDHAALDHAWNVFVGDQHGPGIGEFFASTGVRTATHAAADIGGINDLLILPDRRILVSSAVQNRVALLSDDGVHLGTFITGGPTALSGINTPTGMLLTPSGTLLVASRDNSSVVEFNAQTGARIRALIPPSGGGLVGPFGLAIGAGGRLFVTSADSRVLEYNVATGAFVREAVAAGLGGLSTPRGVLVLPDGSLLVCSFIGGNLLRYDGSTGAFLGRWNRNGTNTVLTLDSPWCLRYGPEGDVYASRSHTHRSAPGGEGLHQTDARVYRFDVTNGNFVRAYILGEDAALDGPTGFDFMPGDATDCNRNQLPDVCDISQGSSRDRNLNGRPDECDCLADWSGDGAVNSSDVSAFLTTWLASLSEGTLNGDFNDDAAVNSADISAFLTAWLAALTGGC